MLYFNCNLNVRKMIDQFGVDYRLRSDLGVEVEQLDTAVDIS
jgi:hypothetical protein